MTRVAHTAEQSPAQKKDAPKTVAATLKKAEKPIAKAKPVEVAKQEPVIGVTTPQAVIERVASTPVVTDNPQVKNIEAPIVQVENQIEKPALEVGTISCVMKQDGQHYFLPFATKDKWVSGYIYLKIKSDTGEVVIKQRFSLSPLAEKENGYTFPRAISYMAQIVGGGAGAYANQNVQLKSGVSGEYQLVVFNAPSYLSRTGTLYPSSPASKIGEAKDTFTFPNCD